MTDLNWSSTLWDSPSSPECFPLPLKSSLCTRQSRTARLSRSRIRINYQLDGRLGQPAITCSFSLLVCSSSCLKTASAPMHCCCFRDSFLPSIWMISFEWVGLVQMRWDDKPQFYLNFSVFQLDRTVWFTQLLGFFFTESLLLEHPHAEAIFPKLWHRDTCCVQLRFNPFWLLPCFLAFELHLLLATFSQACPELFLFPFSRPLKVFYFLTVI